jgi:hypothetical protein
VTIVPGSGGAKGQQVASCNDEVQWTVTLYCQVNVTAATSASASGTTTGSAGAPSLQAHTTDIGGHLAEHYDGPVVHSGCSTIMDSTGKPYPAGGKCCFV